MAWIFLRKFLFKSLIEVYILAHPKTNVS